MILKSGTRFSEKIMLKQRIRRIIRFSVTGSWSEPQSLQIESIGALTFWSGMIFSGSPVSARTESGAGFFRIMRPSMIRKSMPSGFDPMGGTRRSEKIMRKQTASAG